MRPDTKKFVLPCWTPGTTVIQPTKRIVSDNASEVKSQLHHLPAKFHHAVIQLRKGPYFSPPRR
jgi:hypothetical protein